MKKKVSAVKKVKKTYDEGIICIRAEYNNTIVTLTDMEGRVIGWSSPGMNGFKGSRQSTPYAGQVSAEKVCEKALACGMQQVKIQIKGPGGSREQAIRGIINSGLEITEVVDLTNLPHAGCKSKRVRKV